MGNKCGTCLSILKKNELNECEACQKLEEWVYLEGDFEGEKES